MIERILLVDDDADFAEACRNFLEAAGYVVDVEDRSDRVMEKIREFRPDLVLLDVLMGDETAGFTIADAIAGDDSLKNLPVVFLTGWFRRMGTVDREDEYVRKWANVRYVLDKPVKPSVLLSVIEQLKSAA